MFKLIKFLTKRIDKTLHFLLCYAIFLTLAPMNFWVAIGLTIACGIVKEVIDKITYNGWCWYDILADSLGLICGIIGFILFSFLRF